MMQKTVYAFLIAVISVSPAYPSEELPEVIDRIKPSILAIGTFKKTQSPQFAFRGTGFVIGNGNQAVTNAHVLPELTAENESVLVVLIPRSTGTPVIRRAQVQKVDPRHDLATVSFEGPPLPALNVGDSTQVREGRSIAFTGFPIGGTLGFTPVTHRGIISAITPIAIPTGNAQQLNEKAIRQLRQSPIDVFQLDATAYPGNSGSPVYNPETGDVIGIINMVFVKGSRETALSSPSGITYAIPASHIYGPH